MPHRRAMPALTCLVLLAAACGREAPPAVNTFTITAVDHAFQAPDTVPAGMTRIVYINNGPSFHHAQLVRLSDGRTYDSMMAAMQRMGPTDPPPPWFHMAGGPNTGMPGDTTAVTQMLEPGHYALICMIPDTTGAPHIVHGMSRPLEVTAAPAGPAAAAPAADITVTLADYSFTESAALTAGTRTIRVVNAGPQPHEIFIARLDSTTTTDQVIQWVATMLKGPPPAMRAMTGTAAMGAGTDLYLSVNLAPGRYGLFCFIPAPDGREHTQHGMVKEIRVS